MDGGLNLRTATSRRKGGKSVPGIVPVKPGASLTTSPSEKGEMPPERQAKKLAIEQIPKPVIEIRAPPPAQARQSPPPGASNQTEFDARIS